MKLVSLLSNGLDSPVASYIMSMRGADVTLLHLDNRPYTDDRSIESVNMLVERLREVTGKELPLYMAPHGENQARIHESCEPGYQCVMCKRVMQKTAKEFSKMIGASGIIMGDSLGQVASQTLRNLKSENTGLDYTVVRPLIGMDKLEIIEIAKEIGTFDISIRPTDGCTIVPIKPVTEASVEKIGTFESVVDTDALARTTAEAAVRIS
ncbi:MAG: tRNA 4-thiouridine(8) synthase ThiI [Candidatus Methanomethylophilaceae archaeon]|nr:tRNA 4-thiouridine(8) synthase ThiI [Candidatus Methanomethylophilaceae archaeon]